MLAMSWILESSWSKLFELISISILFFEGMQNKYRILRNTLICLTDDAEMFDCYANSQFSICVILPIAGMAHLCQVWTWIIVEDFKNKTWNISELTCIIFPHYDSGIIGDG